jgi:hypothetical protein
VLALALTCSGVSLVPMGLGRDIERCARPVTE